MGATESHEAMPEAPPGLRQSGDAACWFNASVQAIAAACRYLTDEQVLPLPPTGDRSPSARLIQHLAWQSSGAEALPARKALRAFSKAAKQKPGAPRRLESAAQWPTATLELLLEHAGLSSQFAVKRRGSQLVVCPVVGADLPQRMVAGVQVRRTFSAQHWCFFVHAVAPVEKDSRWYYCAGDAEVSLIGTTPPGEGGMCIVLTAPCSLLAVRGPNG